MDGRHGMLPYKPLERYARIAGVVEKHGEDSPYDPGIPEESKRRLELAGFQFYRPPSPSMTRDHHQEIVSDPTTWVYRGNCRRMKVRRRRCSDPSPTLHPCSTAEMRPIAGEVFFTTYPELMPVSPRPHQELREKRSFRPLAFFRWRRRQDTKHESPSHSPSVIFIDCRA